VEASIMLWDILLLSVSVLCFLGGLISLRLQRKLRLANAEIFDLLYEIEVLQAQRRSLINVHPFTGDKT